MEIFLQRKIQWLQNAQLPWMFHQLLASSEEYEATSSDEEEEEDSEGEGSSSSEQGKSKNPPKTKVESESAAQQVDDSESETETETESDSDDVPTANAKPIASRPIEETQTKPAKPTSKPSVSTEAPGKSTAKRGNEVESDAKDSKRAKRDSESNGVADKSEDANKKLFQRLWSEDDEIVVLKGMVDFYVKKGIDPAKDMNSFCDFIKKSLTFSPVLSQLKDKVWRLKKRFENHSSKVKCGEYKTFSKPHEQKLFDLSKRIWGKERICSNNNSSRAKKLAALKADLGIISTDESEKTDKKEVETENHFGITRFDKRVDHVLGMEDYVMKKGMDMLEGVQKAEMEEKWRDLHVAELELFLMRNELLIAQAELMLAR